MWLGDPGQRCQAAFRHFAAPDALADKGDKPFLQEREVHTDVRCSPYFPEK
jgi:hypothetical protein